MARRRLQAGEQVFCALSWGDGSPPETFAEAHERLSRTGDFWHEWIARGRFPDHPWRAYLQRSALTLKGLIYAPTGAMLAAATTSLPETPGGERNYDYRYSWLRDSTFLLWASTPSGSTARRSTTSTSSPISPRKTPTCRSCTGFGPPGSNHVLRPCSS
jgi:alpha,alpha-trehalase